MLNWIPAHYISCHKKVRQRLVPQKSLLRNRKQAMPQEISSFADESYLEKCEFPDALP